METEEDNYYDIEKWLCLDKELSYCLNIAKENYKTYKNQYIKVKANEKYFYIGKSYRFTSIKDMKNIINKIKEYIYMYIKDIPYSKLEYHKDSANCSIFYISINKIITKWLINNICYYIHINRTKNAHLRIYK